MSEAAMQLLPQLLALPTEDREMLARELFSSLDEEDEEQSREFEKMLDRRIEEMKTDPSKSVPADEVFRKLREKYP